MTSSNNYLTSSSPIGGNLEGLGPLGNITGFSNIAKPISQFNKVMMMLIGFLTVIAGLWFFFTFFFGALEWLTSGGDKNKTENAQKKITSGIVGLVIVIFSVFIVEVIGKLLGLEILSPGKFVQNIWN